MPDDIPKLPRHRGKKNRPKDTPWKQQRLPSLRPHYNVASAIPVTLFIGIATLSMGIALYFGHQESLEQEIDYTDCALNNGTRVSDYRMENNNQSLICTFTVTLKEDYTGDVKFYYGLSKFYQNNRLYFNSRNDQQLRGNPMETDGCEPIQVLHPQNNSNLKIPVAPCGVVADSMFNDTFKLTYQNQKTNKSEEVPWTASGVLGATEIKRKFANPKRTGNQTWCDVFQGTVRPPSWKIDICQLGANNLEDGIGFQNIDFMVWMKTAALPKFRKPYRILKRQSDTFLNGLPKGNYTLEIKYNYPVDMYKGTKSFVIARENWVGPRNLFLPVIYLVVGTFLLLVTVLFILIWLKQRLSRVHPT